jgi:hypothetical protein
MRKIIGLAFAAAAALAAIAFAGEMDRLAKVECNQQIAELNNSLSVARAHTADEQARLSQIEAVIRGQDASGTIEARDIRSSTHQELIGIAESYRSDLEIYLVHLITRNSFGLMTRKLSVTESQRSAQFRGTFSRRKLSVASANWAHVA